MFHTATESLVACRTTTRHITCNSSNKLVVSWDQVQLSLSYGEFVRLVQQAKRKRDVVLQYLIKETNPALELIEIDCGKILFRLSPKDHLQFTDLLSNAFDQLGGRAPRLFALMQGSHPLDNPPLPYEFLPN